MRQRRPERFLVVAALAAALAGLVGAPPAAAQAPGLDPGLAAELRALAAEKAARTPAQRKLSSSLLYEARLRRGLEAAPGVAALRTGVEVEGDGRVRVDLDAEVTPALVAAIESRGGTGIEAVPGRDALRARLPLAALEALAARTEVRGIRPADLAYTRAVNVSQGDLAHRAAAARAGFGVDGSGVAVGVLSDGVDSLATLQASGDLPPSVTVLAGQAGSGHEGAAMLEIVHDLAPGASLLFATAFGSQAAFASNILALRTAGADVIVDDVGYFAEGVFQDDDVAAAVDAVVADGALYFSAAGNGGNLDDGTAGVWEGDWLASAATVNGDPAHDFGGGVFANTISVDSPFVFTLQWSDPLAGAGNDYDLFLVNAAATQVVAASTNVQNGNDDPYEQISSIGFNDAGRKLVVVRASGAARFLHVNTHRGRLALATAGQTHGHAAARGAVAVAAVDWRDAGGAGGAFDGSESVETYSSDGPRRVFYEADGTPTTPGDLSATGGELRPKPDLAAADCVSTAAPGFSTFCGTSAAAPHAAAIAALLIDLRGGPGGPGEEIRDALAATALDIEAAGVDRDAGAGIAEAFAAAAALDLAECADGVDNDGDGLVDHPADPGCSDAEDASERGTLACDNGGDDDGDGLADYPADPGCRDAARDFEDPQCQNGIHDDGDGLVDFDGGESIHGACAGGTCPPGVSDPDGDGVADPDPQCVGRPYRNNERPTSSCGLGLELVLLLPGLAALRARRSRAGAPAGISRAPRGR
jgi:hypothetical protein